MIRVIIYHAPFFRNILYLNLLLVEENDTLPAEASKETYIPSVLLFHEEIMKIMNVKPTIPKTEKDARDIIMEEIKKDALSQKSSTAAVTELSEKPPLYMTMTFYARNLVENLKFWK